MEINPVPQMSADATIAVMASGHLYVTVTDAENAKRGIEITGCKHPLYRIDWDDSKGDYICLDCNQIVYPLPCMIPEYLDFTDDDWTQFSPDLPGELVSHELGG